MNSENKKIPKQYFMRKSGVIVCLDGMTLYYLNSECEWVPNQEWYVSMFVDGDDEYTPITERQVTEYISDRLNSRADLNYSKKAR